MLSRNAGMMKAVLLLLITVALMGCSGESEQKKEQADQGPVPMKVVKAETRDMPNWGEYVGQVSARETVEIRARVAGFLAEKKFEEGRLVKKGDLLFVIDPKEFKEDLKSREASLANTRALLNKASKDLERFKKLYDEGVVSRDEYESYQTQAETYQAQIREKSAALENARIQLGYTEIHAPIDGVIGRVMVTEGNLVGQGENTLLATISSQDPVYVNFNISENDYVRAMRMRDTEVNREVKILLADGKEYPHEGHFDMVDPTIDPQTGSLGIRVVFPNPDNMLRPGQYAKVRVLVSRIKDAVVIPARGVMDVQGMKSVYVVGEDGSVVSRPVKLGFESTPLVVVTEGLKADEMVIVDGVRRVRPGMTIKPIVVSMSEDKGEAVPLDGGTEAAPEPSQEADSGAEKAE